MNQKISLRSIFISGVTNVLVVKHVGGNMIMEKFSFEKKIKEIRFDVPW